MTKIYDPGHTVYPDDLSMRIHIDPVGMPDPQKRHNIDELQEVLVQLVISSPSWRIGVLGGNWLQNLE
jgi:hypothetical protein